jgi:hypothetical protein
MSQMGVSDRSIDFVVLDKARLGIVNLKIISLMLPPQVGDCGLLSATNGGHFHRFSLKLTMPWHSLPTDYPERD